MWALLLGLATGYAACGQEATAERPSAPVAPSAGGTSRGGSPDERGAGGDDAQGTAGAPNGEGASAGKGGATGGGSSAKGGTAGKGGAPTAGGKAGGGGALAAGGKGGAAGKGPGGEGGGGKPVASTPLPLRVANYNAQNVFNDLLENPTSAIEKENTPTTADYQKKLAGVADVLSQLAADIVVLEEIENEFVLADLRAQPAIVGKYPHQAIFKGNDQRGIDIGLVSAIPIIKAVSHEKESFTNPFDTDTPPHKYYFSRDVLEVHFQFNTRHVILLGVHLKSKIGVPAEVLAKQIAEATQTRKIADALFQQDPTAAIVILGDFNNSPGTEPLQIIAGKDPLKYTSAVAFVSAPDAWTVDFNGHDVYDDQYANPLLAGMRDASTATILHLPAATKPSDHEPVAQTYQVK